MKPDIISQRVALQLHLALHTCAACVRDKGLMLPCISSQSMPLLRVHLVQSLVDDDMVRMEKIGISNYYWSFPSEASVKVRAGARGNDRAVGHIWSVKVGTGAIKSFHTVMVTARLLPVGLPAWSCYARVGKVQKPRPKLSMITVAGEMI